MASVTTAGQNYWQHELVYKQQMCFYSACRYCYPMDRIIQQFKYQQQLQFQALLAGLLLQLQLPKVQALVAMPISTQRLNTRGYNQALLIAKIIAKVRNIPIWQPIIRTHQHAQTGLNRFERLDNIYHQFHIKPRLDRHYHHILIIDDVVTTGNSILALKHSLTLLGCTQIYACCIAHTPS